MEYYFDQLDPIKFQRLVNTILVNRFGEDARLTPLRGKDGGRDGETAPGNPYFEFRVGQTPPYELSQPPRKGRYLFQVKHHIGTGKDARSSVIADFKTELQKNVLNREGDERVNYFFLITNVPSSTEVQDKIDKIRRELVFKERDIHADVWWHETIAAYLDQMPSTWISFPEMFAGNVVPFLAEVLNRQSQGLPRSIRLAITHQYNQDKIVKFRQIELEKNLAKLFVDLDVNISDLPEDTHRKLLYAEFQRQQQLENEVFGNVMPSPESQIFHSRRFRYLVSALGILLDESKDSAIRKLILEGGPGQGKSTITQMAVQIYRQQLLATNEIEPENRWTPPRKARLPFRLELRRLAEWLNSNPSGSIEEYLTTIISQDSGGNTITVDGIHSAVEKTPVLLIFDGLDEIGNDKLRSEVLKAIKDCINRFEDMLQADLRVIVTTRPPALVGQGEILIDFERLSLAPMEQHRIEEYLTRWLAVQISDSAEKKRIRESFERRQDEPHVEALAKNPMQLSVLLQFIRLKGEAFPDRRAELYRDYFQIVIDRDVEKSPELRRNREVIQALHEFIGYKIHALTEVNQADRTLERQRLLDMVRDWLKYRGHDPKMAQNFFKLGEERFGLIVASKGEGEETRYGYAIQPIQEYFSAAFINNQILPDAAHNIFEAMINRSYWREVALFLAGLRRQNEKVDLIARARNVDRDSQLGWYQNGRAIILQLLQEGVFSEPPYVYANALDFLFELLDPKRLNLQREPSDLLASLETLINPTIIAQQQKKHILRLLQEYETCEDSYIMLRLHYVASRLLSRDNYLEAVMSYKGKDPELIASVRLGWPYRWKINIEHLIQNASFWHGVDDHIWVYIWWRESLRSGLVHNIEVPTSFHQLLVEQFAVDLINGSFYMMRSRKPFIEVYSTLAAWKMIKYQQMLQVMGAYDNFNQTLQEDFISVSQDNSDIDYTGLEEPFQTLVKDIVGVSHALLVAFCANDEESKSHAVKAYLVTLQEYLKWDGLIGWVACRCLVNLIQGVTFDQHRLQPQQALQRFIDKSDLISFVANIQPFYSDVDSKESKNLYDDSTAIDFLVERVLHYPHLFRPNPFKAIPEYVRVKVGEKPVHIAKILSDNIQHRKPVPYKWIKTMPLPPDIINSLIEESRDCLPDLLNSLSSYRIAPLGASKRLKVQDTHRLLKIARESQDPKILTGATIALANAKFLLIAETGLILKLLRFDSSTLLTSFLFRTYRLLIEHGGGEYESSSAAKEISLIKEVAKGIFDKPEAYSFQTVCQATTFLAEHSHIELSPLLYEEDNLGMKLYPS